MKFKQIIAAATLGLGLTAGAHAVNSVEIFTLPELNLGNLSTYATDNAVTRSTKGIGTTGTQYWDFVTFTVSNDLVNNGSTVDLSFGLYDISTMLVVIRQDAGPYDYNLNKIVGQEWISANNSTMSLALEAGQYTVFVSGWTNGANLSSGYTIGFSPTAVPEPETYAMMLAGLGIVGMVARRRKMKVN
jgi:hypothetical protein